MQINTDTTKRLVGKFIIESYQTRCIWYNILTSEYTITDKHNNPVDDPVRKVFQSLADIRTAYIAQYKSIEFLSVQHTTPTLVGGIE